MAPAAAHSHPAGGQVHQSAQPPQPVAVVPAGASTDALDGPEGRGRRAVHADGAGIDEAAPETYPAPVAEAAARSEGIGPARLGEVAILVAEGAGDRFADTLGLDVRKGAPRGVAADDGRMADAVDELAADPGVDGCHQTEPEAGEARGQQRYGEHQAAEPALAGVLPHEVAVRDAVGASDLEDLVGVGLQVEGGGEVLQQVRDRYGLGRDLHPLRRHHEGEALHEGADHLEGETPRADDDGSPELEDLHPRLPEDLGDLEAAPKMRGELLASIAESAEVDDAAHSGTAGLLCEIAGGPAVLLLEVTRRAHGVHHVEGGANAVHGASQALPVEDVGLDDLRGGGNAALEGPGTPGQAADALARRFQRAQQPPADVAGGAGEEDRRVPVLRGGAGRQWRRRRGSGRCGWARCGARCSW